MIRFWHDFGGDPNPGVCLERIFIKSVQINRWQHCSAEVCENTFSPPSLRRFSRNSATRRMFVGNRKHPIDLVACPLKEIRGQKPHIGDFRTPHQDFVMSFRSAKKFYNFKTIAYILMFTGYVYQTC